MRIDAFSEFITETVDATQAVLDLDEPAAGEPEETVEETTDSEEATVTEETDSTQSTTDELVVDDTCNKGDRHRGRRNCNDDGSIDTSHCTNPCKPSCVDDTADSTDTVDATTEPDSTTDSVIDSPVDAAEGDTTETVSSESSAAVSYTHLTLPTICSV